MKTGDIVKIEGGFFKADNGTFLVVHSPGDPSWSGSDYSLRKSNKKGVESESKYSTAFWPLMVTVSSQEKRFAARTHNAEHATIEVIGSVKVYELIINQNRGWNDYESKEIVTEKRYQELLANKYNKVEIVSESTNELKAELIVPVLAEEVETIEAVEVSPVIEYKFKISDKVNWRNSNGVNLGVRTVIRLDERCGRPTYYIDPIDTPWFSIREDELTIIKTEEPKPSIVAVEAITPTTTIQSSNLINESLAQRSKENMSFSDYTPGSATAEFNQEITEVTTAIEKAKAKVSEEAQVKLDRLLASHTHRYATWTNKRNANGAGHVSAMICGPSNYNMSKHNKYLSREGKLWAEYDEFKNIYNRIESIVTGDRMIKSNDANAIDKLKEKLANALEEHAGYKAFNAQARKDKTAPHMPYVMSNSNGRIKGIKDRIAQLERAQARGTQEVVIQPETEGAEGIRIVDNVEAARLQIFFNGKPSAETRTQLKKNGFRWTPSISAWQSYRSDHASRAAQEIVSAM